MMTFFTISYSPISHSVYIGSGGVSRSLLGMSTMSACSVVHAFIIYNFSSPLKTCLRVMLTNASCYILISLIGLLLKILFYMLPRSSPWLAPIPAQEKRGCPNILINVAFMQHNIGIAATLAKASKCPLLSPGCSSLVPPQNICKT